MASTITALYNTPASATTQNTKRYVSDQIRRKFPESAKLLAMIADGDVKKGVLTQKAGFIPKKAVDNERVECYTYTPLAVAYTATADLSGTNLTVSSTSGLTGYVTLLNTANGTTARVDSVTNTTVAVITSVGGTAFAVTNGDVLLLLAPAYEQGSADPKIVSKNEDNVYNVTQIMRFPIGISDTAKNVATYFSGSYFDQMKKTKFMEAKRTADHSLLFGNYASSGNTTSGGSTLTSSFQTTKGLYQWAANEFNAGGSMTADKFRSDLPLAFTERTVGMDSPMKMFCGNTIFGKMQSWVNEKMMVMEQGDIKQFGLRSYKFLTSTFMVEVIPHDAFNVGALAQQALLFNSDELFYAFIKNRDLQIRQNIQSPSTDGQIDEFYGEIALGVMDGGASVCKVVNWN